MWPHCASLSLQATIFPFGGTYTKNHYVRIDFTNTSATHSRAHQRTVSFHPNATINRHVSQCPSAAVGQAEGDAYMNFKLSHHCHHTPLFFQFWRFGPGTYSIPVVCPTFIW